MPTLMFVTVPTDPVLNKEGKVRFPGTDKAVERLTAAGWTVEIVDPLWPNPLKKGEELKPDAALVCCYKAVPRSRDAASMLARMSEIPVYTLGVTQGDDAFRTMAPTVGVLKGLSELPAPS